MNTPQQTQHPQQMRTQTESHSSALTFGDALEELKKGAKIAREGWNGKGMYLWWMPPAIVKVEWCREPHLKALAEANGGEVECLGTIRMKTADDKVVTGWVASQVDMAAADWMIVDP